MDEQTARIFADAFKTFAAAFERGVAILERVEKRIVKKMDDDDARQKARTH